MNWLAKLLLTSLAILLIGYLLPGLHIESFWSAFILTIVLTLLNLTVKPVMVILTIPLTIVTLGLFHLITNTVMVLIADYFVDGVYLDGFWWAFLFGILLSFVNGALDR